MPLVLVHIDVRRRPLHERRDSAQERLLRAPDNEEREDDGASWIGVHPIAYTVRLPHVAGLEVDESRRDEHTNVLEQIAESMHVRGIEQKVPASTISITCLRKPSLQVDGVNPSAVVQAGLVGALAGGVNVVVAVAVVGA